jgi:predicted DNA-binding WGR domain protein
MTSKQVETIEELYLLVKAQRSDKEDVQEFIQQARKLLNKLAAAERKKSGTSRRRANKGSDDDDDDDDGDSDSDDKEEGEEEQEEDDDNDDDDDDDEEEEEEEEEEDAQEKKASRKSVSLIFNNKKGDAKVWSAMVNGSKLILQWGKDGSKGQTKQNSYATPSEALAELETRTAKKLKEGYRRSR